MRKRPLPRCLLPDRKVRHHYRIDKCRQSPRTRPMLRQNEAPDAARSGVARSEGQRDAPGHNRACDPVTLEIIRGAIRAAQAEMEALIERTAISAFIREKKDFYTSLF